MTCPPSLTKRSTNTFKGAKLSYQHSCFEFVHKNAMRKHDLASRFVFLFVLYRSSCAGHGRPLLIYIYIYVLFCLLSFTNPPLSPLFCLPSFHHPPPLPHPFTSPFTLFELLYINLLNRLKGPRESNKMQTCESIYTYIHCYTRIA